MYVAIQPKPPQITVDIAIAGAIAGVIATLFASYLPARATNKVDPAEALRSTHASAATGAANAYKLALAGVLIAAASPVLALPGTEQSGYMANLAIMVGFSLLAPLSVKGLRWLFVKPAETLLGIPGRLALDNVERSLGRSTSIVIALMLAIAMSMTVGAYATSFESSISQWVDDAFPADAVITAGSPTIDTSHLPFSVTLRDKIKDVPGIEAINPVRNVSTVVTNKRVQVQALDTRVLLGQAEKRHAGRKVIDGPEVPAVAALYEAQRVIISGNLAHFSKLGVGDEVTIDTPSGPQKFSVYSVVVDYSSDQGWMMIDQHWYEKYWHDELVDLLEVYLAPGVDRERTGAVLREKLGDSGSIFVTLHDALRDTLRDLAASVFAYSKAPELITLLVAIMGVIGTMLAAVLDRIREIGMLRAIGATRWQVTSSLIVEAGFLGFAAAFCGVVTGVPQGFVFMRVIGMTANGWHLPYSFPFETALRVSSFVVIAAALSGYFPGRRAAGMDVKEALSYE
jgi:putative ABC transport system permease protein